MKKMYKKVKYIPDFVTRFVPCFYGREEYDEEALYDNRAFAAKLYIETIKKLTYEEYLALSALLILTACWNEEDLEGHYTSSCNYTQSPAYPVSISLLARFLNISKPKIARLLKSALIKMPELKALFKKHVIESIEKNAPNKISTPDFNDTDDLVKILEDIGDKMKERKI